MEVRAAEDCFTTESAGIHTRHAFSFGGHFDPANVRFGRLVAHNEERLEPGAGYDPHRHAGLDVVSWVLEGELTHADSSGATAVVRPGVVQHLHTGAGVEHSERNDGDTPLRFLQFWLLGEPSPPPADDQPTYTQSDAGLLRIGRSVLRVVALETGHTFRLPEATHVHVSVARGSLDVVGAGGTLRVPGGGQQLSAVAPTQILVWEMEE